MAAAASLCRAIPSWDGVVEAVVRRWQTHNRVSLGHNMLCRAEAVGRLCGRAAPAPGRACRRRPIFCIARNL